MEEKGVCSAHQPSFAPPPVLEELEGPGKDRWPADHWRYCPLGVLQERGLETKSANTYSKSLIHQVTDMMQMQAPEELNARRDYCDWQNPTATLHPGSQLH